MELRTIKLSDLCLRRTPARKAKSDDVLERSIAEDGILKQVIVRKLAEDVYEVIDGERRIGKAKELHARSKFPSSKLSINCVVVKADTEEERAYWRLVFNLQEPLPNDEATLLYRSLGQIVSLKNGREDQPTGLGHALDILNEIILQMNIRQNAVRGAGRILDILEVARESISGSITTMDAVARIKRASSDEN